MTMPNTSAEILLKWGDGEYLFKLRIKEIGELQRLSGVGIGEIAMRVIRGQAYITDIYDTIRLGLIGGGQSAVRAKELVDLYVEGRPLADFRDPSSPLATAIAVLKAVWLGIDDLNEEADDLGKVLAAMAGLTLPPSSVKARTSAGRRSKRKK